jgi:hypothetical protein
MGIYITLEQAKDHLRVDFDDDDIYIGDLIDVAETVVLNEVQAHTVGVGTVSTVKTTALTGSGTEFFDYKVGDVLKVDGESERTISAITTDLALTVGTAFSNTDAGLSFTIKSTPEVSGVLPKPLFQAMLLMVGHLYATREPVMVGVGVVKCPYTLDFLIAPYKTWVVK